MLSEDWPRESRLDLFREAVWELRRDGHVEAFLTTTVSRMRSFPFFWVKRERLWYQVNWLDGRRDEPREDYGPGWYAVAEFEQGRFEHDEIDRLVFDVKPVEEPERAELWQRYGPP